MNPEEEIAHLKRQQHRIMGPNGSGMSAAELRDRVLNLIRDYLTQPKVQTDEISALTLNALAGDIQVIRLDSSQIAGVPYVRPCPKCGLVPMPPCTCVELGDGEPSPPPELKRENFDLMCGACKLRLGNHLGYECPGRRGTFFELESGAAQEVSPPFSIREPRTHWLTKDLTAEERAKLGGMKFEKSGAGPRDQKGESRNDKSRSSDSCEHPDWLDRHSDSLGRTSVAARN